MNPSSKLTPQHLERTACVYIRQSSLRQVEENLESQDLQYQLVQRACSLGWKTENIQVIDDDLGKSAVSTANRSGFQGLVAAVGLGQVGMILVTDVSRLARNCTDWFSLLDLASLRSCLISDTGGIYDPRIYDDRLLLGLKGTFAEAQWYSLRAQLGAAKFNKAKRGDLHLRLPVGFIRITDNRVALHPDQQVQSTIRHIFAEFERLGSAHKTLRALRDQSLLLPRRTASSWDPDVRWVRPAFSAIYAILKNPAYAGAYAYGKLHCSHLVGEAHKVVTHALPQEEWPVLRLEAFPGYISWDTYQRNQQRLAQNAQGAHWKGGAPRAGLALLQGIASCGHCGRRLHVHYTHATAYVCDHATQQYAGKRCQTFTSAYIDPFIEQLFLQAVQPARLQAALAALDQIDAHRLSLLSQSRRRLERARYDADLARRRYERVDPDNRLVAASLEQDWENCLRQQATLEKELAETQSRQLQPLSQDERRSILALASDLPDLWRKASPADRKRLLRCLVLDVTLDSFSHPGFTRLLVRWRTGAVTSLDVPRPPHGTPPATHVANRLHLLARHLSDDQIASQLNAEGFPTATGLSWTLDRVRAVRRKHKIPTACPLGSPSSGPRGDGLLRSTVVAQRLAVHPSMISQWFRQGLLSGRQRKPGGWLWIRLTQDDLHRLDGSTPYQPQMIPLLDAPERLGLSPDQFRAMIAAGHFTAFRIHSQDAWRWFLLPSTPNPLSSDH
jgi:DNA invertase Pin-like site-specific DNA recombinase